MGVLPFHQNATVTYLMLWLAFTSFPLQFVPPMDMNGIAQQPMQCFYSPYSWQRWGLDRLKHHFFGLVPRTTLGWCRGRKSTKIVMRPSFTSSLYVLSGAWTRAIRTKTLEWTWRFRHLDLELNIGGQGLFPDVGLSAPMIRSNQSKLFCNFIFFSNSNFWPSYGYFIVASSPPIGSPILTTFRAN